NIKTGNRYREFTALMRQQYDLGKKDSLVTDSTVIPLFYPRLRFEHTLTYNVDKYQYFDFATNADDTAFYQNYDLVVHPGDSLRFRERWKNLTNDFSIYQFPDAKNLQQFVKLGAFIQNISAQLGSGSQNFYNLVLHGEYRNKTRNHKWDAELSGNLYTAGFNSGDYNAHISLKRFVGRRGAGYAEIGFETVNRSPSFLYDPRSNYHLDSSAAGFKKENTTHIFASIYQPGLKLRLSGDYYLVSNYLYFHDYFHLGQYEPLFNLLQVSAQKIFRLGKHFNWYADVYVQQKTGAVPLNLPTLFTRNRLAFEGVFYRNLNLFTGIEVKYHTPYKADGYSPVLGQFFYQDSVTITNRPDISAFLQFRIRGFKAFIRAENLNTMRVVNGSFGFTKNNLAAPGYPYPGLQIRIGIWWSFVR
ncbi:MAG TPA: putative porin, partial [Chitinophagaceae bacterium]